MAKGITQAGPAAVDFQEGPSSSMVGMRASCASLARLRISHPYCMAGPTYEVLFQASWTPESGVQVEVVPGASAINACAALVGAPLTHDFCSISLSYLLTSWPVIAWRLDAVAASNFVVALYHPKSVRRTQQIPQALLLRHRRPDTPVAVVKSAYRRRERIGFITLDNMSECDIGMLTTVLIGNSQTLRAAQPDGHAARLRLQVRPQRQWHHSHWRESRTLALHRPRGSACPPCRWRA